MPSTRTVALAIGTVLAVSAPAAAAVHREPEPPKPRPALARSELDREGVQTHPAPGVRTLPSELSALSWLVADAETGDVLAAHDAHKPLPPASTLKSLFALTVLPRFNANTEHRATSAELADVGEGSSLVGVSAGHMYQVADLWRGVFLSSGNDAVHVLAAMNGGVASTVKQMQARARSLGALDTHVVSPDGYDAPGQVSSAFDLAVFGREGLANRDFARYCGTALADFPGDGTPFRIENTNRLLSGEDGVKRYPGLIGIKNGYTTNAGNTLIAAARHKDHTVLVTVMNPQEGDGYEVYEEARALLDWGFNAAGRVRPVGSLVPPTSLLPAASQGPASAVHTSGLAASDSDSLAWQIGLAAAGLCAIALTAYAVRTARRRAEREDGEPG
ncbi:D-alanyl-D-alanine carboxypeptidase family protein [Streptomyces sp. NPDC002004]